MLNKKSSGCSLALRLRALILPNQEKYIDFNDSIISYFAKERIL